MNLANHIQDRSYESLKVEKVSNILRDLMFPADFKGPITFYTGRGGMMSFYFKVNGRQKLPRKLKKSIYGSKKDRMKHIPEYYKK